MLPVPSRTAVHLPPSELSSHVQKSATCTISRTIDGTQKKMSSTVKVDTGLNSYLYQLTEQKVGQDHLLCYVETAFMIGSVTPPELEWGDVKNLEDSGVAPTRGE